MVLLISLREYMSKTRRKKTKHIDTDVAEQEEERETGDIYDDKQRGEMLKADGITAAENAFMQGQQLNTIKPRTYCMSCGCWDINAFRTH
jgi:hypothetical protein